jgi:hypothetical protein
MRQAYFRYYYSPIQAALLVCAGIGAVYGGWRQLPLTHTWPFLRLDKPTKIFFGLVIVIFATVAIYAAASPWLRKRSMTRPLIIIDDAGLWLREVGELMRWSEIQSVECGRLIQPRCTIVWRHKPIRIIAKGNFMDCDGNCLLASSVYSAVKELWEQNRAGLQA